MNDDAYTHSVATKYGCLQAYYFITAMIGYMCLRTTQDEKGSSVNCEWIKKPQKREL